jgi:hypothetical protein
MLDSWSTHDYEQNVSLDSMKTCLVCDLCFLGFGLNVHCALHVLSVWFVFVKKIMFSCFFFVLICFLFDYLFFFSFRSNHGFQFGSGLNQYFRVKSIGFFMSSTKALFGWFLLLLRNFWPKRLFDKHTFRSILTVLFWIKKIFLPNRAPNKFPKKISRTNLNLFLDSSHIFPAILFIKRVVDLHCKMLT